MALVYNPVTPFDRERRVISSTPQNLSISSKGAPALLLSLIGS
jgi:hypothetical protein